MYTKRRKTCASINWNLSWADPLYSFPYAFVNGLDFSKLVTWNGKGNGRFHLKKWEQIQHLGQNIGLGHKVLAKHNVIAFPIGNDLP